MDTPNIVLSGSAVFHGDVHWHFHTHVQPTKNSEARNDDGPMPKMLRSEHFAKSDLSVCSENAECRNEAFATYPGLLTADKDFYLEHIDKEAYYQVTHRPKGLVLLINNEFRDDEQWRRKGSEKDFADMDELWTGMGCNVVKKKDLNIEEMIYAVKSEVSRSKKVDFFVAIIMSHGGENDFIIGAEGFAMEVKKIVDVVAGSKRLRKRPKLIFFQMCRGQNVETDQPDAAGFGLPHDSPIRIQTVERNRGAEVRIPVDIGPSGTNNGQGRLCYEEYSTWVNQLLNDILKDGRKLGSAIDESDEPACNYIFDKPDILLAFASQPDHVAFRNTGRGSWFIQSMKKVFSKNAAKVDVISMMEEVQKEMAKEIVYSPGSRFHMGRATLDSSYTFGKKRLFLFPGFPEY